MNIGLLGFGVVGGGVWELAQENRALNVKKVLVRREVPPLVETAVQDVEAILRDPDIDTVVEVLGVCTRPMNGSAGRWRGGRTW